MEGERKANGSERVVAGNSIQPAARVVSKDEAAPGRVREARGGVRDPAEWEQLDGARQVELIQANRRTGRLRRNGPASFHPVPPARTSGGGRGGASMSAGSAPMPRLQERCKYLFPPQMRAAIRC